MWILLFLEGGTKYLRQEKQRQSVQTGIGVGIIAFLMGCLVERKKQEELRR